MAQDVGDEKLALAQAMADLVESKNRFLESSAENLDFERDEREHAAQMRRSASGHDHSGLTGAKESANSGGRSAALNAGQGGHNSPAGHNASGGGGGKGALSAGGKAKNKAAGGHGQQAEGTGGGKDGKTGNAGRIECRCCICW